jgi:hypothetical protein
MGRGDFERMTILIDEISQVLPHSSPWETAGGHDELATVIFLRGAILSSYGFIETQLNELAIRSSRFEIYHSLRGSFPRSLPERLDYLTQAFGLLGPLYVVKDLGIELVDDFRKRQVHRNKWAHGQLKVHPGNGRNRWLNSWITVTNFNPRKECFDMSIDRWTGAEILQQAIAVKVLSDRSNEIHCRITQSLPEV